MKMKTGNRKCWKVVNFRTGETVKGSLTQTEANSFVDSPDTGMADYLPCMEGFKVVFCNGEAHSNAHIDHCMVCLGYHWGYNMVPDGSVTFWFQLLKEARDSIWNNSKLKYEEISDSLRELERLEAKCYRAGI